MIGEIETTFDEVFNTAANIVRGKASKCYTSIMSGSYRLVVLSNECVDDGQIMIDMEELEGYIDDGYEFYDLNKNRLAHG